MAGLRHGRFLLLALVLGLAGLALSGCAGEPAAAAPVVVPTRRPPPTVPLFLYELPVTATPWPTFTPAAPAAMAAAAVEKAGGSGSDPEGDGLRRADPAPTVTPAAYPEARRAVPAATVTPTAPTPTPLPTAAPLLPGDLDSDPGTEPGDGDNSEEDLAALSDYGKLPDLPVYLDRQVLFVTDRNAVGQGILDGDFSRLGFPLKRVSERSRFVWWGARWLPAPEENPDFVFAGVVRVRGWLPGGQLRLTFYAEPPPITPEAPYFLVNAGSAESWVWKPGRYLMEFIDPRTEKAVLSWEFEVYQ